jgi:hypothetical protein
MKNYFFRNLKLLLFLFSCIFFSLIEANKKNCFCIVRPGGSLVCIKKEYLFSSRQEGMNKFLKQNNKKNFPKNYKILKLRMGTFDQFNENLSDGIKANLNKKNIFINENYYQNLKIKLNK